MSTYTGTPTRTNIRTSVDLIGQLINMYRLPDESLAQFKERVLDNYVHGANATYEGLYNGINRELGLDAHLNGLFVDVVRDVDGLPINSNLGLEVSSRYLTLYSDHESKTVQASFDLHDRNDSYFIGNLETNINSTAGWEAVFVGSDGTYKQSSKLLRQSSLKYIRNYRLKASQVQNLNDRLINGNFLAGSVAFSTDSKIDTEVFTIPTSPSEFMVDYNSNVIHLGQMTTGYLTFSYQEFPLLIKWSPITIHSFKDEEFLDLVTEQIVDGDGLTVDGVPTVKGAEYINELLSIAPSYWGE